MAHHLSGADFSRVHIDGSVVLASLATSEEGPIVFSGGAEGEIKAVVVKAKAEVSKESPVKRLELGEDLATLTSIDDAEVRAVSCLRRDSCRHKRAPFARSGPLFVYAPSLHYPFYTRLLF